MQTTTQTAEERFLPISSNNKIIYICSITKYLRIHPTPTLLISMRDDKPRNDKVEQEDGIYG